jgi:hypothetical protein
MYCTGLKPAFLLLLLPGGIAAAQVEVRGRVVTADSTPLAGALVDLMNSGDTMRTSGAGEFRFRNARAGRDIVRVRMVGYQLKLTHIEVNGRSGWTGTIVLERVTPVLPEVSVTAEKPEDMMPARYADFHRRQALGIGTFRTREDIEKKAAFDMVSVLQGIPGVRISQTPTPEGETEVRMDLARCKPPRLALYVDGQKQALFLSDPTQSGGGIKSKCPDCVRLYEALSAILLRDVEFVEFYRGPGQIPSELDRGDACAALVVWTR